MTTKTQEKLKIVVRVEHDQDTESPFEYDCFKLQSGFHNLEKMQDLFSEFMGDDYRLPGEDFWMLSCYRHGNEHWSLLNEGYPCQWDTTKYAGVLYLENPKDRDQWKNAKVDGKQWTSTDAARSTLETYNRWLSGDCWWYRIEAEEETNVKGCCSKCGTPDVNWYERSMEEQDSCGGFIGLEHALDEIQSSLFHGYAAEADKYEVVIKCDEGARCYESDIAERVKKVGLTLRGER